MARAAAVILVLALGVTTSAWAKSTKKAEAAKAPKKPEYKAPGGPLPPLPKPTELSLHFAGETTEAESYATEASAVAAVTGAVSKRMAWNVAQWRAQLGADVKRLGYVRKLLGNELRAAHAANFPVAVRYVSGSVDSAGQLLTLSEQTLTQFNALFTTDRDDEVLREPPEASRRVRLYLDRVESLYSDARKFIAGSTQGRAEKVERLEDDAD